MKGQNVCRVHGGASAGARRNGIQRVEEARAKTMLQRLGNPEPVDHPVYELLALLAEMKATVAYFRERMADLDSLHSEDQFGIEHERAVVLLYERAVERFQRTLSEMARLDLQTRALALQRDAAADMMKALVLAMSRMGLTERTPELRAELSAVLREMHGRPVPALEGVPAAIS
jgi:hypothetical protein